MVQSLLLEVPGTSAPLLRTKLNEALTRIYNETDWSFQTGQAGWLAGKVFLSAGTYATTPYSNKVVADAAASSLITALVGRPFITELQFRNPAYTLYNIIASDTVSNPPFVTLTLDRPWMEPTVGAGQPYMIYQAYFPAPVADFTKFVEIRDTTNGAVVSFLDVSQDDLSTVDPQRLIFGPSVPTFAVPWGVDQRPNSATLGYVMYELWPHVLSYMPFSFSYKRTGPLLAGPNDVAPYPITEELIKWRTQEVLFQFKEAQKGEQMQRGSGADWRFLSEAAREEYKAELKVVRRKDSNLHNDFITKDKGPRTVSDGYSTNRTGRLNIGGANW